MHEKLEDLFELWKFYKKNEEINCEQREDKIKAEFLLSDYKKLLKYSKEVLECYLTFDKQSGLNSFVEIFKDLTNEESKIIDVISIFEFLNKEDIKKTKELIKNYYDDYIPFLAVQMILVDNNLEKFNSFDDDEYIEVEVMLRINIHTKNLTTNFIKTFSANLYHEKDVKKDLNKIINDIKILKEKSKQELEGELKVRKIELQMFCDKSIDNIEYIKVYDVGNANFSIGFNCKHKPKVVFDLGCRSSRKKTDIVKVFKTIDDDGFFIISHFDYDHINGFVHLDTKAFNRIWYLPYDKPNLDAKLTERNLFNKIPHGNIRVIRNTIPSKLLNITIFKGVEKPGDKNQSNSRNANGLISIIKNEKKCLIPGDSLYLNFPVSYNVKNIDTIIIPHHSCKYEYGIKPYKLNFENIKEAFIPTNSGRKKYGHPNKTHLDMFPENSLIRFDYSKNGKHCFTFNAEKDETKDVFTQKTCDYYIKFDLK